MFNIVRTEDIISVSFSFEEFLGGAIFHNLNDELRKLIDKVKPSIVWFDLTDIGLITSEILGLFIVLYHEDVKVVLSSPSDDVRAIIETTKLDTLFEMVSD